MTVEDPFHHLHVEDYDALFARPLIGAATLVDPGGRPAESLAEGWRLVLDPFEEGLRQRWFALDDAPVSQWNTPRDWDREAGLAVTVPSCWNTQRPDLMRYEGAVWYVRDLHHRPGPPGERLILRFGAANYAALMFLGERFLGRHLGGSTPFCVEITGLMREGPNRLMVLVENTRTLDRVPMRHIDWFNWGGLHREVTLMRLPPVFVRTAGVALVPGSDLGRIAVDVTLSDPVDGTARVTAPSLGLDAAIPVTGGEGRIEIKAQGALWSPDAPVLHDIAIAFGADTFRERVGLREIAVQGTEILLNGRPVWLGGACVHEDDIALGRVTTEADLRRRFRHLRAMNANFARLAHYPHHDLSARIADEEGVMLWAEVPVYWAIDFANPATLADAANQLAELILRDRNRASVVIWGVGNENADTDARLAFMAHLADLAKRLDPTRLVAAACLIDRTRFAIADRLAEHLDVIGLNEYFGWYEPDFSGLKRLLANSDPTKPVVVSESGADAAPGRRGERRALFSEDWQAAFHRRQVETLDRAPWVRGYVAWLLYDFRSDRRQTSVQGGFNRKGLIAEDKATTKMAFAALRELFATRTRPQARSVGDGDPAMRLQSGPWR